LHMATAYGSGLAPSAVVLLQVPASRRAAQWAPARTWPAARRRRPRPRWGRRRATR
jgi:hypothetical protein